MKTETEKRLEETGHMGTQYHLTTGAGYRETHPGMVTMEDAMETYRMTVKNERVEDYPHWVRDVATALNDGDSERLGKYGQWVMDVYLMLKEK